MIRAVTILLAGLVTSFFLFPFNLPVTGITVNTKMILAVIGAALLVYDKIRSGEGLTLSRDFFVLSVLCAGISIWSFCVTVFNHTADYVFAKYVVSVWVWLAAAYAVVWLIRAVHGKVSVEIVGGYLIAVCTFQCVLAYSMTVWPALCSFVDSLMGEGEMFMSAAENRMHGLGAALDPAGLRFSATLVLITYLTARNDFDLKPFRGFAYIISFLVIAIIGNMIARTTTVGILASVPLYIVLKWPVDGILRPGKSWWIIGGSLLAVVLVSVWFYGRSEQFRDNLRFGFEGFFSLVEKGRWEVRSNETLKGMIVWPETLKTWVIGDGFFDNPQDMPDRFGQVAEGYYKKTDIGYLRFLFYFGGIGLLGMIAAFSLMTFTCIRRLDGHALLFLTLLLVNFVGWLKVSSDIIMVFAPFLILAYQSVSKCTYSTT